MDEPPLQASPSAPPTDPRPLRTALARGWLFGLSLGALEGGLVLGGNANFYEAGWLLAAVPLAALTIDGGGGAALGLVLGLLFRGRARRGGTWHLELRLGLGALWVLCVPALLWVRRDGTWSLNPGWSLLGGALALALGCAAVRGRARTLARARVLLALWVLVPLAGYGLLAAGLGTSEPRQRPAVAEPAGADRPDLVLVTWDTVRGDSLPPLGGGGLETPNLERLAREGTLFTDFQSTASITAPAHLSMLTGLYPPSHGLRANGDRVPEELATLPEWLSERGYATAGFVSGYPLRAGFGFHHGFRMFDDRPRASATRELLAVFNEGSEVAERLLPESVKAGATSTPGDVTVSRAERWLGTVDRPYFLWVHLFDAHDPYDPPEPYRARALERRSEGTPAVLPEAQELAVLQRGEIEQLDQLTGRLIDVLERRDPGLARTVIVLAADHGECFGEGGIVAQHEPSLFAATQHVIGIVRPPGSAGPWARGRRDEGVASQVDLAPTLCELAGLPAPPEVQGASLVPRLAGETAPPPAAGRGVYMEAFQVRLGERRLRGWYRDGWRYVRAVDGTEHLYGPDDGDARDLAASEPARLAELRAELDAALAALPVREPVRRTLSERDRASLEKLGYAGEE